MWKLVLKAKCDMAANITKSIGMFALEIIRLDISFLQQISFMIHISFNPLHRTSFTDLTIIQYFTVVLPL